MIQQRTKTLLKAKKGPNQQDASNTVECSCSISFFHISAPLSMFYRGRSTETDNKCDYLWDKMTKRAEGRKKIFWTDSREKCKGLHHWQERKTCLIEHKKIMRDEILFKKCHLSDSGLGRFAAISLRLLPQMNSTYKGISSSVAAFPGFCGDTGRLWKASFETECQPQWFRPGIKMKARREKFMCVNPQIKTVCYEHFSLVWVFGLQRGEKTSLWIAILRCSGMYWGFSITGCLNWDNFSVR